MLLSGGRAVVAAAFPADAEVLRRMLENAGFSEVICVSDGLSALRQIQNRQTDLLLADMVLPVLDGAALSKRIPAMSLTVYPIVILLTASHIYPKNDADSILMRPVSETRLCEEIQKLRSEMRKIPDFRLKCIEEMLDSVGVPQHCGRDYLIRAIGMVWLDGRMLKQLTARLYPAVAEQFGVDNRHVVRAMRHVIDEAWRSGEMDEQYKLFGDTIDARRGSPTLGEMIAQIADILRWEGKA